MVTTWIQILQYAKDSRLPERSFPASLCTHFLIPQTQRNTAQAPIVKPSLQPGNLMSVQGQMCEDGARGAQGFLPPVLYVMLHIRFSKSFQLLSFHFPPSPHEPQFSCTSFILTSCLCLTQISSLNASQTAVFQLPDGSE